MESTVEGGSGTEITEWLKSFCNIPAERAVALGQRLDAECYMTTLQQLQQMLSSTPTFLDVLDIPKPMQMVITSKLAAYSNKKLEDLSVREVQHLLDQLFPEEFYGLHFRKKKISGFVLKFADNVQKLMEWGISSLIHAEAIWLSVGKWKASGVPRSQLPPADGSISSEEVSSASKPHPVKQDNAPAQQAAHSLTGKRKSSDSHNGSSSSSSHYLSAADDGGGFDSTEDPGVPAAAPTEGSSAKKRINRELASLLVETNPPPRTEFLSRPTAKAMPPKPALPVAKASVAPKKAVPSAAKVFPPKPASKQVSDSASGSAGGETSATLNSRMKNYLRMLNSEDRETQSNALKALSKQAADHPETVGCIRNVGALDKMVDMLRRPSQLDEYILWRTLVALNNTIARSKYHHVKYLVDLGLITHVLPLCNSLSARVRLQSLWILGNMGTGADDNGFKNMILSADLVDAIVESYATVRSLSYNGPDNINQRYAETIKQLACDRTREQFQLLKKLVPLLRDIIHHEQNVEAVMDACHALQHLLDADDAATADVLIDLDILPALVGRLDDSKVQVVLHALETLVVFAECSTSEQVLEMELALGHIERFISGGPAHRPNKKFVVQATLCLVPICEGGDRSVQQILDSAPDIFPSLMDLVRTSPAGQPAARDAAENSALALMCAVQGASPNQLEYFLGLGAYPLAFRLLDVFADDLDIVEETLRALSNLVFKLEDITGTQEQEERRGALNAAEAWASVSAIAEQTVDDMSPADANESVRERSGSILKTANELLINAQNLGLAPKP